MTPPSDLSAILAKYGEHILSENLGRDAVIALTGLGSHRVRRLLAILHQRPPPGAPPLRAPPTEGRLIFDEQGDTMTVEQPKGRISTPEELLAHARIDERIWKVDRVQLVNYEMGSTPRMTGSDKEGWSRPDSTPVVTPMFSLKLWLSRRLDVVRLDEIKADMLREIREAAPRPLRLPKRRTDGQLLYLGAHDVHVGKLAHRAETGQDYGTDAAVQLAQQTVSRLLAEACARPIRRILLPVGHDLAHYENARNETTRGTPQDGDTRYRVMRRYAYDLMVRVIEQCREVAPVHVESVPGNHGADTDLAIAERLEARFWNDPHVTVRASLHPRPYYTFGRTLLGLTHGDGVKARDLPLIMADEMPDAWATSTHREWLLGHFHAKKTYQFMQTEDEVRGVRVRYLPSISAVDYWHAVMGYGNLRAMEGYRYDEQHGYVGHDSVSVHP